MDLNEAIEFLRNNQPLVDDSVLEDETIKKYDEVRKFFLSNPDPSCVPLLLNSFGNGDGFGVYQLIEDVIVKFDNELVLPHLINALDSEHKSVRYWNAQIASSFPDTILIEPLIKLLEEKDSDIRYASITALSQIDEESIIEKMKDILKKEDDKDIIELIHEHLEVENDE
ncbi:HEAT repeat domain-containing protein [Paenibacillus fonticola]|uniref:HEAT repeat domain-containing protein n=1 Tax=Paenibacillus fonticola TaxID=379896 RepID=UPI00035EFAA5|nr:HEAT repeat domain-containing protein [Paenibacillus fonticola]